MRKPEFAAADLFCGGGGTSLGLGHACEELGIRRIRLVAVNHWVLAIEAHKKNFPWAEHYQESIEKLDPRKVVPGGRLNILVASPECTNHSIARGGRPINDQSRATAWHVLKWAQELYIDNLLIENVREFRDWGPIGANGRPLKSKKGKTYLAFIEALRSLGYKVEDRVLNAADFGDATTRQRLFIMAKRGNKRIVWPTPTHAKDVSNGDLYLKNLKPWRPAKEIIDWSIPGESIFNRKRPLSGSTIDRIVAGLKKFGGKAVEPFLVMLYGTGKSNDINKPLPTVTALGNHIALCEPCIITPGGTDLGVGRPVTQPLPTVMTKDRFAVMQPMIQPFIMGLEHTGSNSKQVRSTEQPIPTVSAHPRIALCQPYILAHRVHQQENVDSIEKPLRTITTTARDIKLIQPCIIPFFGERKGQEPRTHDINEPLPVVTSHGAGGLAVPFIISAGGPEGQGRNPKHIDEPLGTVMAQDHKALVQPYIIPLNHGPSDMRSHSIDSPMPAVTTFDAWALIKPFLVKYYGTKQRPKTVDEPVETITAKDRFALAQTKVSQVPEGYILDILFRMLQPHELAAAMSFPKSYVLVGNRENRVKLIGNAVPARLAKALCKALISA